MTYIEWSIELVFLEDLTLLKKITLKVHARTKTKINIHSNITLAPI